MANSWAETNTTRARNASDAYNKGAQNKLQAQKNLNDQVMDLAGMGWKSMESKAQRRHESDMVRLMDQIEAQGWGFGADSGGDKGMGIQTETARETGPVNTMMPQKEQTIEDLFLSGDMTKKSINAGGMTRGQAAEALGYKDGEGGKQFARDHVEFVSPDGLTVVDGSNGDLLNEFGLGTGKQIPEGWTVRAKKPGPAGSLGGTPQTGKEFIGDGTTYPGGIAKKEGKNWKDYNYVDDKGNVMDANEYYRRNGENYLPVNWKMRSKDYAPAKEAVYNPDEDPLANASIEPYDEYKNRMLAKPPATQPEAEAPSLLSRRPAKAKKDLDWLFGDNYKPQEAGPAGWRRQKASFETDEKIRSELLARAEEDVNRRFPNASPYEKQRLIVQIIHGYDFTYGGAGVGYKQDKKEDTYAALSDWLNPKIDEDFVGGPADLYTTLDPATGKYKLNDGVKAEDFAEAGANNAIADLRSSPQTWAARFQEPSVKADILAIKQGDRASEERIKKRIKESILSRVRPDGTIEVAKASASGPGFFGAGGTLDQVLGTTPTRENIEGYLELRKSGKDIYGPPDQKWNNPENKQSLAERIKYAAKDMAGKGVPKDQIDSWVMNMWSQFYPGDNTDPRSVQYMKW